MVINIYDVQGREPDKVGTVDVDGEVLTGDEQRLKGAGVPGFVAEHGTDNTLHRYNGPTLMAVESEQNGASETDEKLWVPYEGPRGGEGWRDIESGRVRYVNEPPGEAAETPEDISEHLSSGSIADKTLGGPTDADGKVRIGLASDASVLTVNDQPAAPLVIEAGQEISFEVESPGHAVYFSTEPGDTDYENPIEANVLVENADDDRYATEAGRLILQTTRDQNRLYYCSDEQAGMGGLIEVVDPGSIRRGQFEVAQKGDMPPSWEAEDTVGILTLLRNTVGWD